MKIFHGLITAVVFFARSQEVRELWYENFGKHLWPFSNTNVSQTSGIRPRGNHELDIFMQDMSDRNSVFHENGDVTFDGNFDLTSRGSSLKDDRPSNMKTSERPTLLQIMQMRSSAKPGDITPISVSIPSSAANSRPQSRDLRNESDESWTLPEGYGMDLDSNPSRHKSEDIEESTVNVLHEDK